MTRIKNLNELKKEKEGLEEIVLDVLPQKIKIYDIALNKAYKINELVREIYKSSYEWYGFLLGKKDCPEIVVDIGLGENSDNSYAFTRIEPEEIQKFLTSLQEDYIINGWIHSHADLGYRRFSGTDDRNMETVLSFVSLVTRKPVAKRKIAIRDLSIVSKEDYTIENLKKGSVSIVIDGKVIGETNNVKIYETIFGSFSYSIVIGDEGWHEQSITYEEKGLLTGYKKVKTEKSELEIIQTGKILSELELEKLEKEIKEKIRPFAYRRSFIYRIPYYWRWNLFAKDREKEKDKMMEIESEKNDWKKEIEIYDSYKKINLENGGNEGKIEDECKIKVSSNNETNCEKIKDKEEKIEENLKNDK
ncbi:MAG: hypothetical protein QXL09_02575 [Candidatus Aenigmatarchaeota archaeon]